ncbi:hypothetical protein ALC53_04795 [Atta colombica]|uniref:Uncharacterized protein n=1 Tax=Atta colombica TaxID=520822 RepID=A0A195BJY2_9HYME|nr:hypothetical protein ALC53_04795 [Atta colombica]
MYPTIEALRQTSKAGVFLICFLAHEERARQTRLVTEFDEEYSIREGKADRNSGYAEHDAICSQYYFIAVHFLITSLRRAQPFRLQLCVVRASASKRTDEIQTRDNFLTLLPGYAANRFATALSTPSPLQPPTLRSNPVSLQIVTEKSRFKGTDAANSHLHSTCSCLICSYNTGDPLCSGEHNSERVTLNRRHFLDVHGDTPGCQALLELGIREHERKTPS